MNIETEGYIYCFSNPSMPGILKIGMTEREPGLRLNEANSPDTWRPPTPYRIELVKRVFNPRQKEGTLHGLLARYAERINPRREFFRVELDAVRPFFDLMDERTYPDDAGETDEVIIITGGVNTVGTVINDPVVNGDSETDADSETGVIMNPEGSVNLRDIFRFTNNPADNISNFNIKNALRERGVIIGKMALSRTLKANGAVPAMYSSGARGYSHMCLA